MKRMLFVISLLFIIGFSFNAFANSLVSIFTFGGSSNSNAGFTLTVIGLEVDDSIKVEVSDSKGVLQTFQETSSKSFISKRLVFNSNSIPTGQYTFKVYKNDKEIDTQKTWVYAGSGDTDNHNGGRLSAKLTSTNYTEGDIAKLEVTLTNIEDLAYEPAYFTVKGNNTILATGMAEVDSDRHMYKSYIDLPLTTSNFNTINISASWGQLGYTRAINIPINISAEIPPSVSEAVYQLSILTDGNGTSTGSGYYKLNERVNIKAIPNSNYRFKRWVNIDNYGTIEDINRDISTYVMPNRNVSIRAEFELKSKDMYNLRLESTDGGEVFGGGYFNSDERVRIIAKPKSGYKFKSWHTNTYLRNISDLESSETYYRMPEQDVIITANFSKINNIVEPKFELAVDANKGGEIKNNPSGTYEEGSRIGLFAEPDKGYKFKEWLIDYGSLDNKLNSNSTLIMPDRSVNITAVFEPQEYLVTVNVTNGVSQSGGKFKYNDIVNISVLPNTDYLFNKWVVSKGNITLDSYDMMNTKFIMPDSDVVIQGEMRIKEVESNTIAPTVKVEETTVPVVIEEKPTEPIPIKGVAPLPKTSDNSLTVFFILLVFVCLIIIAIFVIVKRANTYDSK